MRSWSNHTVNMPSFKTIQRHIDSVVDWLKIIFWLGVIFVLIPLVVWNQFQPTPTQVEFADTKKVPVDRLITRACEVRAECRKLGAAEQECATAGDIDRCIRIKVPILAGLPYCGGGNALIFPENVRPTALQCWRYN